MSFNLLGNPFGEGLDYTGQNRAGLTQNDHKAILYVFKPYANQIKDVGLRPLTYRFDENFIDQTRQIADLTNRRGASNSSVMEDFMARHNFNEHLFPSYNPTFDIKAGLLSDRWRFLLILTGKPNDLSLGNTFMSTNSNSAMRRIYTGYFEDEPLNPQTFGDHHRSLNPNCYMVITHKTVVGTHTTHGAWGPQTSLNTFYSEEIVHPGLTMSLAGMNDFRQRGLHLMTPANCVSSIEENTDGFSISVPGANSDISRDTGANVVSDILEQPGQNVAQVVRGIILTQDKVTNRNRMTSRKRDQWFDDNFLDEGLRRTDLARSMEIGRSPTGGHVFDLDVDKRISSFDLDRMVNGDLTVVPIDMPRPMFYDTADQLDVNVTNQYSFLISSVVGPIMSAAGINEMTFEFQVARRQGRVVDDFRTYSSASYYEVPTADLLQMTKAVEVELTNGIFPVIYNSLGDFHVFVSANATGNTTVRLNLVGQGYRNEIDFEMPSFLGGLITPLLGDQVANAENSSEIEKMYNVATGSQPVHTNFNDDDREFQRLAMRNIFDDDQDEEMSID